MGGAIGAAGNVDAMAEALAKYKEVKGELTTPPPSKVQKKWTKITVFSV